MTKIEVPREHWDAMFAPSSCLSLDATVDTGGRMNLAPHATCTRVCHEPVHVAIAVNDFSHTARNIADTGEFVVNVVSFERALLEKVRIAGLPFAADVNEVDRAGLTAGPSRVVKAPRIEECRAHFECVVEWTHHWAHRLMVCGAVVAVAIDEDCYDPRGQVRWEKLKPAIFCGVPYDGNFVPAYEPEFVGIPYDGPRDWRPDLHETTERSGVNWSASTGDLEFPNVLAK